MTSFLYPYIQESINLNSKCKDNYILTIQHSLDGLSFVIFDTEEQKFLSLKHYHLNENNIPLSVLITASFLIGRLSSSMIASISKILAS